MTNLNAIRYGAAILSLTAIIGIPQLVRSNLDKDKKIMELEHKVWVLDVEKDVLNRDRIKAHHELIKRGNPYEWKITGDSMGSTWYERDEYDAMGSGGTLTLPIEK